MATMNMRHHLNVTLCYVASLDEMWVLCSLRRRIYLLKYYLVYSLLFSSNWAPVACFFGTSHLSTLKPLISRLTRQQCELLRCDTVYFGKYAPSFALTYLTNYRELQTTSSYLQYGGSRFLRNIPIYQTTRRRIP